VDRIRVPVLLGDGGQDTTWNSGLPATVIMQELRTAHDRGPAQTDSRSPGLATPVGYRLAHTHGSQEAEPVAKCLAHQYTITATSPRADGVSSVAVRPATGQVRLLEPLKSADGGLADLGLAFAQLAGASRQAAAVAKVLSAHPYRYRIPFHCSHECGGPIRLGEMFVQTSPDWKPLHRAQAACVAGRKGTDGEEARAGVDTAMVDELIDSLIAGAARPGRAS
jgi:hypothetical protein